MINALKFDKLTYLSSSQQLRVNELMPYSNLYLCSEFIKSCLQSQKSSLLDEINPIISQMEQESIVCTIEVFQSFCIDIKGTSKVMVVKSIINKSLEQVLRSHSVDFNSTVTLPQRLSYEKGKIELAELMTTIQEQFDVLLLLL